MKKYILAVLYIICIFQLARSQSQDITGSVKDARSLQLLSNVTVQLEGTNLSAQTNVEGEFILNNKTSFGEYILKVSKIGYVSKRFPIVINKGMPLHIEDLFLELDPASNQEVYTIILTDDELNDDTSASDNISGLLQASKDVFQRTAALEFSSSFFKIRGLDSSEGKLLINGIEMNSMFNGRMQWSNWGGINDVLRNQEFSYGLDASTLNFGGVLGTTNISTRASKYREGGRLTYTSSNRSYSNRLMASYASGLVKNNWAYALSIGRRWGAEGYQDATFYDANSFFVAVEKKLSKQQSLNFTGFYTPNRRGKSSPNTQEVFDLRNIKYNEYWGYQDGEKRNSRVKDVSQPILMLSHYWDINSATELQTNISYTFGKQGHSRLDYPGGGNPSPAYYQKLPSYYLADTSGPDYSNAYLAEQEFIHHGQINWNRMYDANSTNANQGLEAAFVLYEDRTDDNQFSINSIFNTEVNDHILLSGTLNYSQLHSENFAEIQDLLGGLNYLNVDAFDGWQYDLQNPNALVDEGGKIKYNYNMYAHVISSFAQAQFKYKTLDYFLAINASQTNYQREGLFQNEAFKDNSLGKSEALSFFGYGIKGGVTYKISAKHVLDFHAAYLTEAPNIQNSFSNPRENNNVVKGISEQHIMAADINYIYRSRVITSKLTGFYIDKRGSNEIGFYYADGLTSAGIEFNETSAFVQEVLHNVNTLHFGLEFGIEAKLTSSFKLKAAASSGQYTYNNNPNLYLTSSSFVTEDGAIDFGTSNLKNYKVAGGPQSAFSFGFEYSDPDYWWFGATINYMANTYVDVSPLTRTSNFYLDDDGLPFNDYDEDVAKQLLKQERFDDYFVANLIGGKSWKIDKYYLGLFVSINNVLNNSYKTGGFEQGRNANYRELKADNENPIRVFGPKYWYGRGATYFANVNIRF
ncbi:TonB-dependent receptor [Formosa agariphila KMM 3901]|uniref:TonB-dependent receptor n=1 Tax=Formosa agariphila (strain DSM 15362 / KCTC 12365 / LMG 23005 / KMM 3901 / M-2Alg 35-1) TaxID=1347342 RepID=T2KR62_FORAG|nr:TonB-dependent receptor [Formosa agariphila]CDF81008.1 TonB-dependent receptor [Formosa agariphila KMM 3901]